MTGHLFGPRKKALLVPKSNRHLFDCCLIVGFAVTGAFHNEKSIAKSPNKPG
jgi:hypothetical protein